MTATIKRFPCTIHPAVLATVAVPVGETGRRYLCGPCLREAKPVLFISLPLPPPEA